MLPLLYSGQIALFGLIITALIVSLSFHEFGHAYAAKLFGDDTAQKLGRLTINPINHIHPVGLLMVVLVGFGFAKPVPVNPRNYTSIWAQLVVAAAGPLANLLIAIVMVNIYSYGFTAGWESFSTQAAGQFFTIIVTINLVLMLFNLIPIGPLDGHYILPYFLPRKLARTYSELNDRYGMRLLMGLIVLSFLGLPIFASVFGAGMRMLPYITFI